MSDSDERMLEYDSPEVITKTGNTTTEEGYKAVTKMKTHQKDIGKQNRKTPAEAAGSFAQVAHDGGNAVNYNATQPFRATGAGDSAPKNYKANDQCYKCGGYGHWARQCRKIYNGSKFGVGRGPVVQKDKQRFFVEVDNVENLDTFYEYEFGISDINVEGRLNKSVEFWEQIGTSKFILDVIKKVIQSHYYTNPRKHF